MDSTIEQQRNLHEELERLEQAICDRLLYQPRTIKDQLQLDHEVADFLQLIQVRSHTLKALYDDTDGARSREVARLSVSKQAATQPGAGLEGFYEQYAQLKEYHKRYPNEPVEDLAALYAIKLPDAEDEADGAEDRISRLFSGEEGFGRFFDLNTLHAQFCNLKRNRPVSYTRYLETFDDFEAFPAAVKQDPTYPAYLAALLGYLISFYRRAVPLDVHEQVLGEMEKAFDEARKESHVNGSLQPTQPAAEEGIWCEICQKRYAKQTVYDGHLKSKKHQAGLAKQGKMVDTTATGDSIPGMYDDTKTAVAKREYLIHELAVKFSSNKQATRANVVRKQTLTDREWVQEQEQALYAPLAARQHVGADGTMQEVDETEDAGEKFYNPLKLPLGWDGKPIPFWLWRLHGLGVEYSCEICGNHTYAGRRAFDKHFNEARHLHGLRCLGIENGGLLYDQITQIQDALNLAQRLEEVRDAERKKMDAAVEMEDESGNVMSEKVYKDLVAQGIL
ncbi:putative splicing factor 3a subunit 3 [Protomyces lactucae-debilis]|uniref:Putative splicing factor 3a subunit 3 n=1 Tax=Protomyces lactucae-debilis TaxID=2754530 RepID=A0A1Y2FLM4_PROLT|nr:putative splicing factor 3a subunit 3 [Protomyces lactucae-debilis]ORY84839.1 putative splicing factor 3a subunit 3 [Protomyces lactucae-debilis]